MTEYGVLAGAVVFAAIVTFLALGTRLLEIIGLVRTELNSVPTN
jgi:Flp pilus assembly pilin Flp